MKLDVHNQFTPTTASVQAILDMYGLQLVSYSDADSGIENRTLIVTTATGTYVLRVYRAGKKSDQAVLQELGFVQFLHDNGLPTVPAVLNGQGDPLAKHGTWQAVLMPFMTGEHAASYAPQLVRKLAAVQAQMHTLSLGYRDKLGMQPLLELRENTFCQQIDRHSITSPAIQGFIERAQAYRLTLDRSLPSGLCHLDYDADNVLSDDSGEVVAVLDFDDLAVALFVVCLGYTLWDVAMQSGFTAADEYLDAYRQHRQLSGQELDYLPQIMLFRNYVIGSVKILFGRMDDARLEAFERLENHLMQSLF